jgi:hypothetical protein
MSIKDFTILAKLGIDWFIKAREPIQQSTKWSDLLMAKYTHLKK